MKTYKSHMRKLSLREEKSEYKKVKITQSKEAYEVMKPFFANDITLYESVYILLLNRASNTIGHVKISQGGVCGTVVDVAIIAKYAVETLATGLIIAHNHPSGQQHPSNEDIKITKRLKEALSLFNCSLLDHLILTEEGYRSMRDEADF